MYEEIQRNLIDKMEITDNRQIRGCLPSNYVSHSIKRSLFLHPYGLIYTGLTGKLLKRISVTHKTKHTMPAKNDK